jgi:hypothetical protein
VELKLERCTIRDYRLSDADSLAKHANSRKIWLGLRDAFPHPYTIKDAKKLPARLNLWSAKNTLLHRHK